MRRNGLKYAAPALLALWTGAGAVAAQELVFSMQASESCLSEMSGDTDPLACLGNSASRCMEETDGGYSRLGTLGCIQAELVGWEDRMNGSFAQMQVKDQIADTEEGAQEVFGPMLQKMQREWLDYRNARCDYIGAKEGGDEAFEERRDWCRLEMTGLQTLLLRDLVRNY